MSYQFYKNNKIINSTFYPNEKFDFIYMDNNLNKIPGIVKYYQDLNITFDTLNNKLKELYINENVFELCIYILYTGSSNVTLSVNDITADYVTISNKNIYSFNKYINTIVNSINISGTGNITHVFCYGKIIK